MNRIDPKAVPGEFRACGLKPVQGIFRDRFSNHACLVGQLYDSGKLHDYGEYEGPFIGGVCETYDLEYDYVW